MATNKPESIAKELRACDSDIDRLVFSPQKFLVAFNLEVTAINNLESHLNNLEQLLMNEQALLRMSQDQMMNLYRLLLVRKEVAHKFMLKIAELGIKTDFLNKVTSTETKSSGVSGRPSPEVRKAVSILNHIVHSKIDSGDDDDDPDLDDEDDVNTIDISPDDTNL